MQTAQPPSPAKAEEIATFTMMNLHEALAIAKAFMPSKLILPIQGYAELTLWSREQAALMGTPQARLDVCGDIGTMLRYYFPAIVHTSDPTTTLLLPIHLLRDLLTKPAGAKQGDWERSSVFLQLHGNDISITSQGSFNRLRVISEAFLVMPQLDDPQTHLTVDLEDFKRAIATVKNGVMRKDKDPSNLPAQGINLQSQDNSLIVFASDGIELRQQQIACTTHAADIADIATSADKSAFRILSKAQNGKTVEIKLSGDRLSLEVGGLYQRPHMIVTTPHHGKTVMQLPNLAEDWDFEIDPKPLLQALDIAASYSKSADAYKHRYNPYFVRITCNVDGHVTIDRQWGNVGALTVHSPATVKRSTTILLDCDRLLSLIQRMRYEPSIRCVLHHPVGSNEHDVSFWQAGDKTFALGAIRQRETAWIMPNRIYTPLNRMLQ